MCVVLQQCWSGEHHTDCFRFLENRTTTGRDRAQRPGNGALFSGVQQQEKFVKKKILKRFFVLLFYFGMIIYQKLHLMKNVNLGIEDVSVDLFLQVACGTQA